MIINDVKDHFLDDISVDVDFSENLSIPVKFEPQLLNWSHQQVTVHSGIMKVGGIKSYHSYISNDKKHDQSVVKVVIEEMPKETAVQIGSNIIIESDNCSSQYKSCEHFYDMELLANHYDVNIIHIFGIAEHGKGEVDHVSGLAKTAIRREIAAGEFFSDASDMVCF